MIEDLRKADRRAYLTMDSHNEMSPKLNILYIDHYAGSPDMGMEYRPYYLSKEWVKMGHKVSIIAGDYSHLRRSNPLVDEDMQLSTIDGIDYYWIKTGQYEGNGIRRALTMLRFCYKLNKWKGWIKSHLKPDIVISSSTYPIDSIPAHRIVKCAWGGVSSRHIHEVHDMWPSTLTEIGGMSKLNPFVILMQFGENYAYRHADAVVSLLPYCREYMTDHGMKAGKFFHIPNGIVKDEWEHPLALPGEHEGVLRRLKEEGKFIVGYFGGFAMSQCVGSIVRAAAVCGENANIHFVFVGDGVEKDELVQFAEDSHLKNVTFLSPVNKTAIPSLTEYFDCICIAAKDSPLYRFGVCMNKMLDSMMASVPVVFAINAPKTPVEESGCGIIVSAENEKEMSAAILRIYSMTDEERKSMGQRGRQEVLNKYTYDALANQFIHVMEGL